MTRHGLGFKRLYCGDGDRLREYDRERLLRRSRLSRLRREPRDRDRERRGERVRDRDLRRERLWVSRRRGDRVRDRDFEMDLDRSSLSVERTFGSSDSSFTMSLLGERLGPASLFAGDILREILGLFERLRLLLLRAEPDFKKINSL